MSSDSLLDLLDAYAEQQEQALTAPSTVLAPGGACPTEGMRGRQRGVYLLCQDGVWVSDPDGPAAWGRAS